MAYAAAPPTAALLRLYADPGSAGSLGPEDWSAVLGAARRSRTLGHLALRLTGAGVLASIEPAVVGHLRAASLVIRRRRQQLRYELIRVSEALQGLPAPIVLLKGAAYEMLGLPLAGARVASDLDIMVPRDCLAQAEQMLLGQGWQTVELDAYDDRYYREWSHEVPPLTHPARGMEVDLHHAIAPGLRDDARAAGLLLERIRPIPPDSTLPDAGAALRVLDPVDQILHVALHCFASSDLSLRLREVMDFDLLVREYCVERGVVGVDEVVARAGELGQQRPLWWAIHFARRWLATPIANSGLTSGARPLRGTVRLAEWLVDRAMLPGLRQRRTGAEFAAEMALLARYQWQRLPIRLLVPHVAEKIRRRVVGEDGQGRK